MDLRGFLRHTQKVQVPNDEVPIIGVPLKGVHMGIQRYIGSRVQGLRVQVTNNLVLGCWVAVITVQVLGRYVIVRYLDT